MTPEIKVIEDCLRQLPPERRASAVAALAGIKRHIASLDAKGAKYDAINTPELVDFLNATQNEALRQREKWGRDHDGGKTDADWFWLIGYLAGKALHNPARSDMTSDEARLHRIITVSAAAANWHAAVLGAYTRMRLGIEAPT